MNWIPTSYFRAFSKISRDSLLALVTRGVVGSLDRYFGRLGQMLGTAPGLKNFRFRLPRLFPWPRVLSSRST